MKVRSEITGIEKRHSPGGVPYYAIKHTITVIEVISTVPHAKWKYDMVMEQHGLKPDDDINLLIGKESKVELTIEEFEGEEFFRISRQG